MRPPVLQWLALGLGLFLCVWLGRLVTVSSPMIALAVVLVAFSAVVTLVHPVAGMCLLILAMLLTPEVSIYKTGDAREVVLRLDDFYAVGLAMTWFMISAIGRKEVMAPPLAPRIAAYLLINYVSSTLGVLRGEISAFNSLFYNLKYTEYAAIYYIVYRLTDSEKNLKAFLTAGLLCCLGVTAYAYYQMTGSTPGRITTPFEVPIGAEMAGNEANTLAVYYLLVFGVILGLWTQMSGKAVNGLVALAAGILPPFLMTLSRAGYAGLLVLIGVLLAATRQKRLQLVMALLGAFFLIQVMLPSLRRAVLTRILYTFTRDAPISEALDRFGAQMEMGQALERVIEPSAGARVLGFKILWNDLLPKHPILGWGTPIERGGEGDYVRVLGETGLLGMLVFLWLVSGFFQLGWAALRECPSGLGRGLGLGVVTALSGFLVTSLAMNTFVLIRVMEPFWALVGMVAALPRIYPAKEDAPA